jgi:CelD/BcsL family acetyltransferase involved in cellulose biosynthesis
MSIKDKAMFDIKIYDSLEDEKLEKYWKKIHKEENYLVQNSYEWISTWWDCFRKKSSRLFVVTAYQADDILGIGPFMIEKKFFHSELKFIGSGFTDFHEILTVSENKDEILTSILDFISNPKRCDLINFEQIPDDSCLYDILDGDHRFKKREMVKCPIIKFADSSWEDYLKNFSKNFRRDWTKKINRIQRDGELEFKRLKNVQEEKDFLEKMFDLHIKCGEYKRTQSRFIREKVRRFFTQLILEVPGVVVYVLLLNGELIAYRVGFDQSGIFYTWNTAYHPRFNSYSIGRILLGLIIKDLIGKKYKKINMMRGDYDYKRRWMTSEETITNYQFLSNVNPKRGYLGMRYYMEWKWLGKRILSRILGTKLVQKIRIKRRY